MKEKDTKKQDQEQEVLPVSAEPVREEPYKSGSVQYIDSRKVAEMVGKGERTSAEAGQVGHEACGAAAHGEEQGCSIDCMSRSRTRRRYHWIRTGPCTARRLERKTSGCCTS
jgi:hypothetical protein